MEGRFSEQHPEWSSLTRQGGDNYTPLLTWNLPYSAVCRKPWGRLPLFWPFLSNVLKNFCSCEGICSWLVLQSRHLKKTSHQVQSDWGIQEISLGFDGHPSSTMQEWKQFFLERLQRPFKPFYKQDKTPCAIQHSCGAARKSFSLKEQLFKISSTAVTKSCLILEFERETQRRWVTGKYSNVALLGLP